MTPLGCYCPHLEPDGTLCAAAPGEPCRWTSKPHPEFHPERAVFADECNTEPVPIAVIDRVADQLGLD